MRARPTGYSCTTPLAAWFGSSNATTTDLFDWGMTTQDPILLTALTAIIVAAERLIWWTKEGRDRDPARQRGA